MAVKAPVFVALTAAGADTARRLAQALPGARVHGYRPRINDADQGFDDVAAHLRALFRDGQPLVALCSTGIVVRALAPVLADKHREPPVVVVDESGAVVVPLLGGHHGANDLARRLAGVLGVEAAVTTASDARYKVALDDPPVGYSLAQPAKSKAFMARLLAGEGLRLEGEAPWVRDAGLPLREDARLILRLTAEQAAPDPDVLVIHPRSLVVGVGCERGCEQSELNGLVHDTLRAAGLAAEAVACVVSIDVKSDEPAVHAVAASLGVPARFFDAATLEAQTPRLRHPSERVFQEVGCHGVAEGAALAAVPDGDLRVAKIKSRRATCAVAQAAGPVDPRMLGQPRGELMVVGLGPGGRDTSTPAARDGLDRAEDLVGYGLYLDLAGVVRGDPRRHEFALGQERERVRHAFTLAASGRRVALVCSGDPGIYAMASLVFEELEAAGEPHWRRVAIAVVAGTSAMQAAAALAGAPLGHDFCAISLSDLLTPWARIEARIEAAAQADFVVAFYNPVSSRRTRQLAAALAILRAHRPPGTPVVVGRNLGREGQSLRIIALSELSVDQVDMLTVLIIGSSQTRRISRGDGGEWVFTPRGYAAKREPVAGAALAASP